MRKIFKRRAEAADRPGEDSPECDIVCDLMPLYIDKSLSQSSRRLVRQHLQSCGGCRDLYEKLRRPEAVTEEAAERKLEAEQRRDRIAAVAELVAFLGVAVAILVQGVFFLEPEKELLFSILCFYILLPLSAMVCSGLVGIRTAVIRWFAPLLFLLVSWGLPKATLGETDLTVAFITGIAAAVGLLFGIAFRSSRRL